MFQNTTYFSRNLRDAQQQNGWDCYKLRLTYIESVSKQTCTKQDVLCYTGVNPN